MLHISPYTCFMFSCELLCTLRTDAPTSRASWSPWIKASYSASLLEVEPYCFFYDHVSNTIFASAPCTIEDPSTYKFHHALGFWYALLGPRVAAGRSVSKYARLFHLLMFLVWNQYVLSKDDSISHHGLKSISYLATIVAYFIIYYKLKGDPTAVLIGWWVRSITW